MTLTESYRDTIKQLANGKGVRMTDDGTNYYTTRHPQIVNDRILELRYAISKLKADYETEEAKLRKGYYRKPKGIRRERTLELIAINDFMEAM